jgi:hypothetical protein
LKGTPLHLKTEAHGYRLKELDPEEEVNQETLLSDHEAESMVKETVITGAPSQYVSDRNRDRPQTPTHVPSSPLRGEVLPNEEPIVQSNAESPSSCSFLKGYPADNRCN